MSDTAVDEFLAHYGVLGMRWGKRKAQDGGGSDGGGSDKPTRTRKAKPTSAEIKEARGRQDARARKFEEAQAEFYTARTAKGADVAERIMRQREYDLYKNPDAETAGRMTKGEKWVSAAFIGAPVAIALLGGRL